MKDNKIGFIGLGNVGSKIAYNILKNKNYHLYVFDLNKNATNRLVSKGAILCNSLEELINTKKPSCFRFGQQAEILCQIIKKSKNNYDIPINYNGRSFEDGKKIRWYHFFSVIYHITVGKFKK